MIVGSGFCGHKLIVEAAAAPTVVVAAATVTLDVANAALWSMAAAMLITLLW